MCAVTNMAALNGHAQRGRPQGRELVMRVRGLRLHDLALLRAIVQGMHPSAAAGRYLPELHADARVVRSYLLALAREARAHLEGLGEGGLAGSLVRALRLDAVVACRPASAPSLQEFTDRFDADLYGERELLALYEEEYGASAQPGLTTALTGD